MDSEGAVLGASRVLRGRNVRANAMHHALSDKPVVSVRSVVRFAGIALGLLSVGRASRADEGEALPILTVLNWSDYIDPKVYSQFGQLFHCQVKESTFDSPEEALNKMIAGGSRTFDVCAVGGNFLMPAAIAEGVLKELDHARIPNLKNLAPQYQNPAYDPGNRYSIPYQWGTTGVVIRRDLVPPGGFSLAAFFDPARELGRFDLIDSEREMLGYANLYQGKPLNSVDVDTLRASIALLTQAKNSRNCVGFDPGVGGRNKVAAGAADYAIGYSGGAVRLLALYPGRFAYVIPREGAPMWVDTLGIAHDAPHPDLAYAFLNYILEPKIGAQISNYTKYPSPNQAAWPYVDPADRANPAIYPSEDDQKRLHLVENLGDRETFRDDAWSAVKSN